MKLKDSDLDNLIRKNIEKRGVLGDISIEQLNTIKEKVRNDLAKNDSKKEKSLDEVDATTQPETNTPNAENKTVDVSSNEIPGTPTQPSAITQTTTINPAELELSKKEGEISQKEKELNDKEVALANREAELQRKEDELKYTPIIPAPLENVGEENFIIFDKDELSKGAEALSTTSFHLKNNPDEKSSMNLIWAKEGKRHASIYLTKFEKIGDITFNPFDGTSSFVERKEELDSTIKTDDIGLTPEDAKASQIPEKGMEDAVEPKLNSIENESPAEKLKKFPPEFENYIKEKMESVLKDYMQHYPKV